MTSFSNPFRLVPATHHLIWRGDTQSVRVPEAAPADRYPGEHVLTGLRGVGKTVLLDSFKPEAIRRGWLWVGTDLSESASVSEETMARAAMH